MTYLIFNTESKANTALAQVESNYNCPVNGGATYKMTSWDTVRQSTELVTPKWYFNKPEARGWITEQEVMAGVEYDDECEELPEGFLSSVVEELL